jgi:hypothetical protein
VPDRAARITLTVGALACAAAIALFAITGAHVAYVVVAAFAMSLFGSAAIVHALAVTVAPGELVVLVGPRRTRVAPPGRSLRLPGERVVRGEEAAAIAARIRS